MFKIRQNSSVDWFSFKRRRALTALNQRFRSRPYRAVGATPPTPVAARARTTAPQREPGGTLGPAAACQHHRAGADHNTHGLGDE